MHSAYEIGVFLVGPTHGPDIVALDSADLSGRRSLVRNC